MIGPSYYFCPECQKEGKKSRVNVGGSSVTLMGWSPYYDEDGRYHSHDPNWITTYYSCSNGHEWRTSEKSPCPSCGERK